MEKINALLLIGHSHSGKTPLGQCIEQHSSGSRPRFHHFDFGERLRTAARGGIAAVSDNRAIGYIRSILDGTLLDDRHFSIAAALLTHFLVSRSFCAAADILVLNGLPRTVGQARDIESYGIDIRLVLHCDCSVEHAYARKMMADRGEGHEDRSRRGDSGDEVFRKKIESFEHQTRPLIEYYASRATETVTVPVTEATTPRHMYCAVEARLARFLKSQGSISTM